ncbi:MAG TPA: flagellar M-ring protein FliF C-terminal domain-containing protein [Candidatus Baltobacteraceae bacterium]|nr:flagellar M-ring protein FliF C-terminal domain-containing protein [Candidatus Baltobacteraceae bacterium]
MEPAALLARWNALPANVRTIAAAAAAGILVLSLLAGLVTHPQRTALFAGALHPEQLAEVQERLASWNVAFTPTGDNVLVQSRRRNDLLLRLSLAGVPHAHIDGSSDVLGKLGALTPQAVIDAQTRDGLAGDIELGLRGIAGVQDVRVIIAPAKQGYFADDASRDASASVRLRLLPGARLSADAVTGIRSFVAASVPGLDERHVTLVDDRGVALGEGSTDEGAGDLQRSLQSALDSAIGAGAAIVRVHVEYDGRAVTSKDVRRSPLSALPISANTQDERYDGEGKRYDRSEQQVERGSETREVASTAAPGRIARISAAVFVDGSRSIDLAQVKQLAAAALGIDPHRGDTIEVAAISFAHSPVAKKDGWWLAYGALVPLLPTLVVAIALLVALRLASAPVAQFMRSASRRAALTRTANAVHGIPPASVRGALANEPPHAAAAIISALPAATAAAVLDMYPEHERAAIIRRMQRPASPLLSDAQSFIANA